MVCTSPASDSIPLESESESESQSGCVRRCDTFVHLANDDHLITVLGRCCKD